MFENRLRRAGSARFGTTLLFRKMPIVRFGAASGSIGR
jgi:hypothetical protein